MNPSAQSSQNITEELLEEFELPTIVTVSGSENGIYMTSSHNNMTEDRGLTVNNIRKGDRIRVIHRDRLLFNGNMGANEANR